jgi:hypothetical protein
MKIADRFAEAPQSICYRSRFGGLSGALLVRSIVLLSILALLAPVLAGCLGPSIEPAATAASAPATGLLQRLNATPANDTLPTVADWFVLNASIAPEGALTAFDVKIPTGSVHKDAYFGKYDAIDLVVAPLLPAGANLTAWSLVAFVAKDGKLAEALSITSAGGSVEPIGLLGGTSSKIVVRTSPLFAGVFLNGDKEGSVLHVVVAFAGASASDAGLAFRFLDKAPARGDAPPKTAEAFLQGQAGRAPVALAVVGKGLGLHVAAYAEIVGLPTLPIAEALRVGDPKVEGGVSPDARPVAGARDQTLSTMSTFARGWSALGAFYFPGDNAVGSWDGDLTAGGKKAQGGAPIAWVEKVPGGTLPTVVLGFPAMAGTGDGEAASGARFHVKVASDDVGSFEALVIDELDLGATLDDLFGTPADSAALAGAGLLAPAFLARVGDDLVHGAPGGAQRVLVGAAASQPS